MGGKEYAVASAPSAQARRMPTNPWDEGEDGGDDSSTGASPALCPPAAAAASAGDPDPYAPAVRVRAGEALVADLLRAAAAAEAAARAAGRQTELEARAARVAAVSRVPGQDPASAALLLADEARAARRARLHAEVEARRADLAADRAAAEAAAAAQDGVAALAAQVAEAEAVVARVEAARLARLTTAQREAGASTHYHLSLQRRVFAGLKRAWTLGRRRATKAARFARASLQRRALVALLAGARAQRRSREEEEAGPMAVAAAHHAVRLLRRTLRALVSRVRDLAGRRAELERRARLLRLGASLRGWELAAARHAASRLRERAAREGEVERRFRGAVLRPAFRAWRGVMPLLRGEREAEERQAVLLRRAREFLGVGE